MTAHFLPESIAGARCANGKEDAIAPHHWDNLYTTNWAGLNLLFGHRQIEREVPSIVSPNFFLGRFVTVSQEPPHL